MRMRYSLPLVTSKVTSLRVDPPHASSLQAIADDGTIYAGGYFTTFGGQTRFSVSATDPTGTVLPWAPSATPGVQALLAVDGELWIGGPLQRIGPRTSQGLAIVEP